MFSLPVYDLISSWLITLSFVVSVRVDRLFTAGGAAESCEKRNANPAGRRSFAAVSVALAAFSCLLAWRTYLSRFPYLWEDHQTFSGVTFSEAHYLLPALQLVAIALLVGCRDCFAQRLHETRLELMLFGLALPLAVFVVGVLLVPAYVTSFIVKPNELGRETPYIEQNITWTRRAFGLEQVELREFEAENSVEALDLSDNRPTLDNIRLWDWRALQDTLKQIQAIRTYYDFPDVDVDRYQLSGGRLAR